MEETPRSDTLFWWQFCVGVVLTLAPCWPCAGASLDLGEGHGFTGQMSFARREGAVCRRGQLVRGLGRGLCWVWTGHTRGLGVAVSWGR